MNTLQLPSYIYFFIICTRSLASVSSFSLLQSQSNQVTIKAVLSFVPQWNLCLTTSFNEKLISKQR